MKTIGLLLILLFLSIWQARDLVSQNQVTPEFPGGNSAMSRFVRENLKYPPDDYKNKIEGKVYISLVVENNGNLSDPKIVKGLSKDCDAEALRLIALMPRWNSAKQLGNPVRTQITFPIKFQIDSAAR